MQGIMIYERSQVLRNQRFIDLFHAAAAQRSVPLACVCTDQLQYGAQDGQPFCLMDGKPLQADFAVMRCMRPLLSGHLEGIQIPVFNNARVSRIANDKRETAKHFTALGLPALPTAFVSIDCPCQPYPYPVVVKSVDGCGGRQVFFCRDDESYHQALETIAPSPAVVQPYLETGGIDTRLYMLDGHMVCAMERSSGGKDFRSNFGLNGYAQPVSPDPALIRMAECALFGLDSSLVGVDFLRGENGAVYLNEIEDAVGTRMIYQYTDFNIVDAYMALIYTKMSEKGANI